VKPSPKRDLPASVKARLLSLAKKHSEQLQSVLVRYAIERLLYRLSQSTYTDAFVLKGAILAFTWEGGVYRPTKDLDLLGRGDDSPDTLGDIFRRVARTDVEPDGLAFDPDSVAAQGILEEAGHQGVRVHMVAFLGKARIPLQVDIGFGDPVTPAPVTLVFPCMLDFPTPVLKAYPAETVIAEKYEALVHLGMRTGRIKDFFDLWYIAMHFSFEGTVLRQAVQATFRARRTLLPSEPPIALTDEFAADASKQALWRAFAQRTGIASPSSLGEALAVLRGFLLPVGLETPGDRLAHWPPGGPWDDPGQVDIGHLRTSL
jgi:predicted nucleotidyltransferase component of viral defense system